MRIIRLTQGYFTTVDDEDYEELAKYSWQVFVGNSGNLYARRFTTILLGERKSGEKQRGIFMHQQILGVKGGDHKDGNGLNNQRYNLRGCTKAQNSSNQRKRIDNISGFKGVSEKRSGRWEAKIGINRKIIYLGLFSTKEEAVIVYREAAKKYFGEFVRL